MKPCKLIYQLNNDKPSLIQWVCCKNLAPHPAFSMIYHLQQGLTMACIVLAPPLTNLEQMYH